MGADKERVAGARPPRARMGLAIACSAVLILFIAAASILVLPACGRHDEDPAQQTAEGGADKPEEPPAGVQFKHPKIGDAAIIQEVEEQTHLTYMAPAGAAGGSMGAGGAGSGTRPRAGWSVSVRSVAAPLEGLHMEVPPAGEPRDPAPDNPFLDPRRTPVSTFGVDVDTGSYTLVRRMLREWRLPPKGVVRLEEFINYFRYDYPRPEGEHPFSVTAETATCPWAEAHRVVRIGLKGREIRMEKRPAGNLVFLLDVSGSMRSADRLPLLKRSMRELVEQLDGRDHVSIVAYASEAALVLPPTGGDDPQTILAAIDSLGAGGSTNGAAGIRLAYEQAAKHVAEDGVNRVILATDGDFNVGATRDSELVELIQQRAETGVYLSILGFGTGNYRDATLEQIADRGNGNYAYIDSFDEAKRVLGEAASGTLIAIAKDVKLQVEFNPEKVGAYRLLGYENRALKAEDFNDDTKDAGDIGAGHTVTALYEIVPAGVEPPASMERVDELEYQAPAGETPAALRDELLTVKLRYKEPDAETSRLLSLPVVDAPLAWEQASDDFRFAMGVACFGMMLRDSAHKGAGTWALAERLAASGTGADAHGHRAELLELVRAARDRRVIASNPSIE